MRFLNFNVANEEYGIQLEKVKEVVGFSDFTPIPNSSPHLLGLMSLRHLVLPVIDFRILLKIEPTLTHDTAVIICEVQGHPVGIVVDTIHTVISPESTDIIQVGGAQPNGIKQEFVTHVVRKEGRLVLVVDFEKLLTASDQEVIQFQSAQRELRSAA